LATATTAATMQALGSLASMGAGSPGVRKNPLFTEKVKIFRSSL